MARRRRRRWIFEHLDTELQAAKSEATRDGVKTPLRQVLRKTVEMLPRRMLDESYRRIYTSPGDGFWSHLIAKAAAPDVQRIREAVLGSPTPAVSSRAAASAWLIERALSEEEEGNLMQSLIEQRAVPEHAHVHLPSGGGVCSIEPTVISLVKHSEELGTRWGWTLDDTMAYILAGVVPPARLEIRQLTALPMKPPVTCAIIQVYPWQLDLDSWNDLRLRLLRWLWRPGQKSTQSADDGRLLDLIVTLGTPPARRGTIRTRYWEHLAAEWGRRYKRRVNPHAVRMRWDRFAARYPELARLASACRA